MFNPLLNRDDKWIIFLSVLIVVYITIHKLAGKTAADLLNFINGVILTTARSFSTIFSSGNVTISPKPKKEEKKDV